MDIKELREIERYGDMLWDHRYSGDDGEHRLTIWRLGINQYLIHRHNGEVVEHIWL